MKYLLALLFLTLLGCKTTEERLESYSNGNPKVVVKKNSKNEIVSKKEFYINNIRKEEYEVHQGQANGVYSSWDFKGGIDETGFMEKGKRTGEWIVWIDSKTKQWQGTYLKGKKAGPWTEYWYEGQVKSELEFLNGDTIGVAKNFNIKGQLLYKKDCFVGRGKEQKWSPSGVLIYEAECIKNKYDGVYKEIDEEGDLTLKGSYTQGLKDQEWYYFRKDKGLWRLETYDQGLRSGKQIEIAKSGDTLLAANLVDGSGVLEYNCQEASMNWCPDSSFSKGLLEGKSKSIHKERFIEEEFKVGVKSVQVAYKESKGKLYKSSEGPFAEGKRHGEWRTWYKDGTLHSVQVYEKGELMGKQTLYDSLGRVSMEKIHSGKNKPIVVNLK
jgi:antitoxin component YwqK of YwqJK toxin-antitoxin module